MLCCFTPQVVRMSPYTYSLVTPSHWSLKCLALSSLAKWAMRRCQPWAPYHAHRVHPCRSTQYRFCYRVVSIVDTAHVCANPTHRPTLPTSKYWLPVLPRRPGVLRPILFLASFVEVAAAMLRGMQFSFSGSSVSNYTLRIQRCRARRVVSK
jgi:hypothetical protein